MPIHTNINNIHAYLYVYMCVKEGYPANLKYINVYCFYCISKHVRPW